MSHNQDPVFECIHSPLVSALSCFLHYTHKSSQNAETIDDYTSIKSTDPLPKTLREDSVDVTSIGGCFMVGLVWSSEASIIA
ncbi:hypothetical protein AB7W12_22865 [Providencia rettgeri]